MPYKNKQIEKEYMLKYRENNKDYFSKKYKEWARENMARVYKNFKKWSLKNQYKLKAHHKVSYALSVGKLIKKPCEVCQNPKSQAHHEDYTKPLEVIWLCKKHHEDLHHNHLN